MIAELLESAADSPVSDTDSHCHASATMAPRLPNASAKGIPINAITSTLNGFTYLRCKPRPKATHRYRAVSPLSGNYSKPDTQLRRLIHGGPEDLRRFDSRQWEFRKRFPLDRHTALASRLTDSASLTTIWSAVVQVPSLPLITRFKCTPSPSNS